MKDKSLIGMLFFVLFWSIIGLMTMSIQGCSISSPIYSYNRDHTLVILDAPPNRILVSGTMNDDDKALVRMLLESVDGTIYKPHHYKDELGININAEVIESRSRAYSGEISVDRKKKGY